MKISIIQADLVWEDKTGNFNNLEKLIMPLFNKSDVVVLPEMFNSGFSMNTGYLGEPPEGETFSWLASLAEKGNFGICGSYIVKENNNYYNRWVFVTPESTSWNYDKRHLFGYSGEDKHFKGGNSRLTFSYRGVNISAFICYDLRFPVWSRMTNNCDLIIYSANWPESRGEVWNILLRARAIENQCYVAGVNRIGTDGSGISYCGDSVVVDPRGNVIAAADNKELYLTAELSLAELSDFRKKFPVQKDADKFVIEL